MTFLQKGEFLINCFYPQFKQYHPNQKDLKSFLILPINLYMFIKILTVLSLIWTPLNTKANPLILQPQFNQTPFHIPQGTNLIPLCANPSSPYCFQEWINQAIPMEIHSAGGQGMNFFLPTFIPLNQSPESHFADEGWKTYRTSISSRRRIKHPRSKSTDKTTPEDQETSTTDKTPPEDQETSTTDKTPPEDQKIPLPGQTEIQHKKGTDEFRLVTYLPSGGGAVLKEGKVSYINEEAIEEVRVEPPVPPAKTQPKRRDTRPTPTPPAKTQPKRRDTRPTPTPPAKTQPKRRDTRPTPTPPAKTQPERRDTRPTPTPPAKTQPKRRDTIPTPTPPAKTQPERRDTRPTPTPQKKPPAVTPKYQTKQETVALPATTQPIEIQEGCFAIDKQKYEDELKTEAQFCPDCKKNSDEEPIILALTQKHGYGFVKGILSELTGVTKDVKDKLKGKIGSDTTVQKICSPEESVEKIIENFKRTCPGTFEDFFQKTYCESCKKGLAPEIMLGMMSIESAGECQAHNKDGEDSVGLFQVNARVHRCRDQKGKLHKVKTQKNIECFKNITNNINYSINVLLTHYGTVNCLDTKGNIYDEPITKEDTKCPKYCVKKLISPQSIKKENSECSEYCSRLNEKKCAPYHSYSKQKKCDNYYFRNKKKKCFKKVGNDSNECKSWLDMTLSERDRWRRGVSAYNGGDQWVIRAIHSAVDKNILKNTKHLEDIYWKKSKERDKDPVAWAKQLKFYYSLYKKKKVDWEKLRFYYFLEKFSPTKTGSGREKLKTFSNIAHTEAVLGREVEGTPPGMVEIWSQYIKENKPNCQQ